MKLLVTVPWGERLGGAEELLWTFLRHHDRSRIETVVVFLEPGGFEREVATLGFETEVVPTGRLREPHRGFLAIARLARILRRERPDLLLGWATKPHLYGTAAALVAGIPGRTAWWQHGFATGHWLDRLGDALPARAILCSSQAVADAQGKLRPRRRTVVIQPGTDSPPLDPKRLPMLRASLGIRGNRVVVGIAGRLQPWKRQDLLIEAVAGLVKRGLDVHCLVVGGDAHRLSPDYEPELRRLVDARGLRDRVTFTGQVDDIHSYLGLMDVFVNASAQEPFGIVLIEAMAAGLPVVAFDSGGPAEIVDDGTTGVLVRDNVQPALVDALDRLVSDSELRRRLGRAGRERYERLYSAERMAERLTDALERLVTRG